MKKIGDGLYEHEGAILEKHYGFPEEGCSACYFGDKDCMGIKCGVHDNSVYYKLKENPNMTLKENQNMIRPFKCAFSSMGQSIAIRQALYDRGMIKNVITVANSLFRFNHAGTDSTTSLEAFGIWPEPLMTFDQAMEMILAAPVLKKEPVFDIKLRDEVLCRDTISSAWEIKHFARIRNTVGFQTFGVHYYHMLPFKGNEHLHGTYDTPEGWWEVKDGKPVWVAK